MPKSKSPAEYKIGESIFLPRKSIVDAVNNGGFKSPDFTVEEKSLAGIPGVICRRVFDSQYPERASVTIPHYVLVKLDVTVTEEAERFVPKSEELQNLLRFLALEFVTITVNADAADFGVLAVEKRIPAGVRISFKAAKTVIEGGVIDLSFGNETTYRETGL